MTIRENISKWLINNKWLVSIFWIIMGVLVEKSCNKIIPDDPIVIKEISDTIKFVHTYDFGITNDSLINIQLQNRLKNNVSHGISNMTSNDKAVQKAVEYEKSKNNPIEIIGN